jgi:hypothetical protein
MNCPTTKKVVYRTRLTAIMEADRMRRKRNAVLHPYPCADCKGFHLSNWELKDFLKLADAKAVWNVANLLNEEINADFGRAAEEQGREIQKQLADARAEYDARTEDLRRQLAVLDVLGLLEKPLCGAMLGADPVRQEN